MAPQASEQLSTPVTERSALSLARAIRARELTAAKVVDAHIALHGRFAPVINAIAADRFDAARADARAADKRIAAGDDSELPPLLGVPFTVKETIAVRGMPLTGGVPARRHERASESARAVQRLVDTGAIPLGVTNVSELTLWIESDNRLYGRTNNPHDPSRTAGGSSVERVPRSAAGLAVRARVRHRRLDPDPGAVLRRVRPQAVGRAGAQHGPVAAGERRVRADARHRACSRAAART